MHWDAPISYSQAASFGPWDMLLDFCWMALLLVVVLFATFPFSAPRVETPKRIVSKAGNMFCFNMGTESEIAGVRR